MLWHIDCGNAIFGSTYSKCENEINMKIPMCTALRTILECWWYSGGGKKNCSHQTYVMKIKHANKVSIKIYAAIALFSFEHAMRFGWKTYAVRYSPFDLKWNTQALKPCCHLFNQIVTIKLGNFYTHPSTHINAVIFDLRYGKNTKQKKNGRKEIFTSIDGDCALVV